MLRCLLAPLVVLMSLSGCTLGLLDLEGRACDDMDRCAAGYACEPTTHICVSEDRADVGLDASLAATDAPSDDAPGAADDAGLDRMDSPGADAWVADGRVTDAPQDAAPGDAVDAPALPADASVATRRVSFDGSGLLDLTTAAFADIDVVQIDPIERGRCVIRMPTRTVERPLVVTNGPGQVVCADLLISGGPHWVLTGRHEGVLGDSRFPGHAGGYADSRGRYGFFVVGGLVIGPSSSVEHVELEFVEVTQREAGAPGALVIGSPSTASMVNRGVNIHDCYIHDTRGSGFIGGTAMATTVEGLEFHRNRVVRAGSACFERLVLGDGSSIHDNIFVGCRLAAPSSGSSEPAVELRARTGTVRFERNLVLGSRGVAVRVEDVGDDDPATATFELLDNNFAFVRGGWVQFDAEALADGSTLRVRDAYFEGPVSAAAPAEIVHVLSGVPILDLQRISWDPPLWSPAPYNGDVTGSTSDMLAGASARLSPDPSHFTASADPSLLRSWDAAVSYAAPARVVADGVIYEAVGVPTVGAAPSMNPSWLPLGMPDDDVVGLPFSPGFMGPP